MERDKVKQYEQQLIKLNQEIEDHTQRLVEIERRLSYYTAAELAQTLDGDAGVVPQDQDTIREPILQKASNKRFENIPLHTSSALHKRYTYFLMSAVIFTVVAGIFYAALILE